MAVGYVQSVAVNVDITNSQIALWCAHHVIASAQSVSQKAMCSVVSVVVSQEVEELVWRVENQ